MALPHTESGFLPGLYESPLEWRKATMTSQSFRWKLSIRLGIIGGIIWGLMFSAYYSMLPSITISQEKRFAFAWQSATICFIALLIIILGLPPLYKAMKEGARKQ